MGCGRTSGNNPARVNETAKRLRQSRRRLRPPRVPHPQGAVSKRSQCQVIILAIIIGAAMVSV